MKVPEYSGSTHQNDLESSGGWDETKWIKCGTNESWKKTIDEIFSFSVPEKRENKPQ
jgi:hypothetical protein